jgi:hypothetical protein
MPSYACEKLEISIQNPPSQSQWNWFQIVQSHFTWTCLLKVKHLQH